MDKKHNKINKEKQSNFYIQKKEILDLTINNNNSITNKNLEIQKKLLNILIKRLLNNSNTINLLEYSIFNKLKSIQTSKDKLNKIFPNGIMEFRFYINHKYKELNNMLREQKFQEADKVTQKYLLKLAQRKTINKKQWLYFTEIYLIPGYDLFIIDLLWKVYSNNKFGFSIQRKIWLSYNQNWNIFLEKIGWSQQGNMKRYPNEFIWNMNAPKGHLPLFNQIRGNQVLLSLFKHNTWIINYSS